jgi:hypothetical protein
MKILRLVGLGACLAVFGISSGSVQAVMVTFTKLTGVTGGALAGTAVYQGDLSGLGLTTVASLTITDNSFGIGGATGQFSGFDLDAIKLSTTDCADAACAQGLAGLAVFDFAGAGTIFTPGAQRAPPDPKLFGTGPAGNTVDDSVATLGDLDGESTTAIPGADGFLSMGDGGILSFNLTLPVSPSGLFLYIGEVGDNGEVAAGNIQVRDTPVPEPTTVSLIALAMLTLWSVQRAKR